MLLQTWDAKGSGEGELNSLGFGGLAVDANDNLFVVDNGNYRIQKFDSDGNFVTQWGSEGLRDGQFQRAIGIALDAAGNVYVTDDGRPEIQVFDNDGNFLRKWGSRGGDDGQFRHPTGIYFFGKTSFFESVNGRFCLTYFCKYANYCFHTFQPKANSGK